MDLDKTDLQYGSSCENGVASELLGKGGLPNRITGGGALWLEGLNLNPRSCILRETYSQDTRGRAHY